MPPSDKIKLLLQLIQILEQFKDHPDSHFNFSKLCQGFRLLPREGEELLDIFFRFQNLFLSSLEGYCLYKKRKNTTLYLALEPYSKDINFNNESNEIYITSEQINILSDVIYYFQHINIGKGFDLSHNGSELIHKVKNLCKIHPYLFEHHGNGLIYPTKLAIELGTKILAYNRGNKPITKVEFPNYSIIINQER
ncbi:MAG: hypothetical protein ACFFBH_10725 [Promethearchaeota archaeon]